MTTFNWMVNQLLICLSTAWCGENEMEREGEKKRGREEKKGDEGGHREKAKGQKNWFSVCVP